MTKYPSTFPQPVFEGFSASVQMGVVRSDMPSHQAQRRVFNTMPHTLTLSFIMSISDWGQWEQWVGVYGYRWFYMDLPTLYAGKPITPTASELALYTAGIGNEKGLALNFIENNYALNLETFQPQRYPPVLIRFTSDVSAANVSNNAVQVSVSAELAPSMISQAIEAA